MTDYILHIFPYEKFTDAFINFINQNFDIREHKFVLFGEKKYNVNICDYPNVFEFFEIDYSGLKRICNVCSKIIVHGCMGSKLLVFFILHPKFYEKLYILFWGGDLYRKRNPIKNIKDYFYEKLRTFLFQRAKQILTLVKGDFDLAQKWYGIKGIYYDCKYYLPSYSEDVIEMLNRTDNPAIVNIQIGNSATETNHHIEILTGLKKFSNENIHIYLPMSYGDFNYREEVEKVAKEWFGEKVTIMKEFYKPEIFNQHLANMDIAIFNNDRQQALGNIYMLICLKAKVYMRSDTSMWDEMTNILGCQLEDVKQIEQETFESFIKKENNILEKNSKIIKKYNSLDYAKEIWTKIFEA
ncbi:TDP-N-acetylfucosamine:lipid II N-acetylfucosaminyltransferase [Eubacterium limosum]|uniref:TDP-N-acetylfucosamine:lipid II N-acetylfucosaminyltransferase n=1 Tax=Eubacterium limosum TaxID=1736 RepID=A0ABT5ULT9_EUBLI|nr:TDP-N-acetylfucosamine:lipid II N-acetylfucosaminyltransferase [Eubacterium limosum]MCB6568322.1 TDP-N-acetylfucosamine:lipid II N-acetylfucosaminyltransferase [Eubacterium limosum]MDE1469891.1 TDP-N-acetylfucosamine:lipid II N-acetylfucosaminyltransferase [Eubacterium limosum]